MSTRIKIAILILGLGVFSYLVYDYGLGSILANLAKMGWWFVPAAGIWAFVYFCNAMAWRGILRDHADGVPFGMIYALTTTGFALNYVTPLLNLGGEPYRVMMLKERVGTHRAVSSVILYNMVRMLSHFYFWLGAIVIVFAVFTPSPAFAAVLLASGIGVGLLVAFFLSRHKHGIFESLLRWLEPRPFLRSLTAKMQAHRTALSAIDGQIRQLYNGSRSAFYGAIGWELLARMISSFEFFFILYALGYAPTYWEALYINAASSLILNLMFFVPFELGTREGGMLIVLQAIGYASGVGIFIGLVNRLREFVWIVIGFLLMIRTGRPAKQETMMHLIETDPQT